MLLWPGAAALLALAAGATWWAFSRLEAPPGSDMAGRPHPVLGRGKILASDGLPAAKLEMGHPYRVGRETDAVLRMKHGPQDSLVRLVRDTEFEVPEAGARPMLRLKQGTLYAYEPGAQPLVLQSDVLEAEVTGLSMLYQEAVGSDAARDEGRGQALVVVLKGSARLRDSSAGSEVTMDEGQLYVTGFPVEPWTIFSAEAEERAQNLEEMARDPQAHQERRALYARTVANYQRDMVAFDAALTSTLGEERTRLQDRRARVKRLLEQHERRLVQLGGGEGDEPPLPRARRLRRAAEQLRDGCDKETDPHSWL